MPTQPRGQALHTSSLSPPHDEAHRALETSLSLVLAAQRADMSEEPSSGRSQELVAQRMT